MRIPPPSWGNIASGIAGATGAHQPTGDSKASPIVAAGAASSVEQGTDADPDRDAQGQGDGMHRRKQIHAKAEEKAQAEPEERIQISEPPSQLDLWS